MRLQKTKEAGSGIFQRRCKKKIRYKLPHMQDFNQIVTRAEEIETFNRNERQSRV